MFVWLLGFVCLLFPDGRHRLHLSSFQVPREIFTALAEALILFPLAGLYDRPFMHSNWKQLSLPGWAGGSTSRPGPNLSPLNSTAIRRHAAHSQTKAPLVFLMRNGIVLTEEDKPLAIVSAFPDVSGR